MIQCEFCDKEIDEIGASILSNNTCALCCRKLCGAHDVERIPDKAVLCPEHSRTHRLHNAQGPGYTFVRRDSEHLAYPPVM